MEPTKIWTTELTSEFYGGLIPIIDPFDNTKFYISDGWGSSYPTMKLRQLSCENGDEIKTVHIKNSVRCLYFNPDQTNLFAVSDNKIFQINRTDFSVIKRFDKGIQKYCRYISSNDKDTLLLMNFGSDFLFVYNYKTGTGTKKKVKTCTGIFKESEYLYLICSGRTGTLQHYNLQTSELKEILKTEIFCMAHKGKSGKIYLQRGKLIEATSTTHERVEPQRMIDIYDATYATKRIQIKFNFHFDTFVVSENEETVYLVLCNTMWIYALEKQKVVDEITLGIKQRIVQLFDERHLILSCEPNKSNILHGWKF
jgi:WD40 repeat protein